MNQTTRRFTGRGVKRPVSLPLLGVFSLAASASPHTRMASVSGAKRNVDLAIEPGPQPVLARGVAGNFPGRIVFGTGSTPDAKAVP
jgi:hypothetical protein